MGELNERAHESAVVNPDVKRELPSKDHAATSDWSSALTIVVAIVVCLVAFVWLFLALNPYLSDFVSSDSPTTVVGTPVTTETVTPSDNQLTPDITP